MRLKDLGLTPRDLWDDFHLRLASTRAEQKSAKLIGLGIALFLIALYNLIFFNRFLPITEGWFSVYAVAMLRGEIPYRDFYLLLPPLYPLSLAAFIHFLGQNLIVLRVLGIALILAMTATSFLIFSRYFSAKTASFASIVGMIYYQSRNEHIPYDFTQFLTFYALLSTYFLIVGLGNGTLDGRLNRKCSLSFFFAGVFAAFILLTKQSNGSLVFVFLLIAVALTTIALGVKFSLKCISIFLTGALVPAVIICAWLYHEGAFLLFLQQVIFDAIDAKGSPKVILFSWMNSFLNSEYFYKIGEVIALIVVLVYGEFTLRKVMTNKTLFLANKNRWFLGIIFITCSAIFIPLFFPTVVPARFGSKLIRNVHFVSAAISVIFFFIYTSQLLRGETRNIGLCVISIVSMGLIFGNGTSAGITQISLFLPLQLLLCCLLSAPSFYSSIQVTVIGLSFVLMTALASEKYAHPYTWWHVSEPDIRSSSTNPAVAGLNGFYLSPATANTFSEVTSLIRANTTPDDHIFTFPNIPIFYLLTDRWPKTMAKVHWFDFLSDDKAMRDAELIWNNPPKMIVNLELPEDVWRAHEILFRGGKKLGQREMLNAINTLTIQSGKYRLEASIPVPEACVLKVWKRTE